jgi:hypothetical protein
MSARDIPFLAAATVASPERDDGHRGLMTRNREALRHVFFKN